MHVDVCYFLFISCFRTLTAVINELEAKIPSGKLKTFLILQPRQQFVRDFAEKNKGLIAGVGVRGYLGGGREKEMKHVHRKVVQFVSIYL